MIAIILVNWNGHRDTIECLESLLRSDDSDFVVIVVDNGSSDGSLEAIEVWGEKPEPEKPSGPPWRQLPNRRRQSPRVTRVTPEDTIPQMADCTIALVDTKVNGGFAAANNIGMRMAARDSRITHFWLLNNDTVIARDCLARLKASAKDRPDLAMIGARLMYYHEPHSVQGVGGVFYPWLARGEHIGHRMTVSELPPSSLIESQMNYVMGASIFMATDLYDDIGPMSESYFLYFEELDWAKRLCPEQKLAVDLDAVVFHKEGGTIGTSSLTRPSDTSLYYLNKNLLRFMWKHHPQLVGLALLRIVREGLHFVFPYDRNALKSLSAAIVDATTRRKRTGPIVW